MLNRAFYKFDETAFFPRNNQTISLCVTQKKYKLTSTMKEETTMKDEIKTENGKCSFLMFQVKFLIVLRFSSLSANKAH